MPARAALPTCEFRPPTASVKCQKTSEANTLNAVLAALNEPGRAPAACPNCGGRRLQRWGFSGGVQRYRCVGCGRCCNPLTGTPLARLRRRDLWLDHARALDDGSSIRAAGRRLGLHRNTTFRWRHRWLRRPGEQQDSRFRGIVEAGLVSFHDVRTHHGAKRQTWRRVAIVRPRTDEPGSPEKPAMTARPSVSVLVVRDRRGAMLDHVLGAMEHEATNATRMARALAPVLGPDRIMLCSDGSPLIDGVARELAIPFHALSSVPGSRHFEQYLVRGFERRLEGWMRRFRGVSTRYLAHYLGWRRVLDRHRSPEASPDWLRLALGPGGLEGSTTMASATVP